MSTIGFSVAEKDTERLDKLVEKFGGGNRSAFLRAAMDQMEVIDRAERLSRLQQYGVEQGSRTGLGPEDAVRLVRDILQRHQPTTSER